MHISRAVSKPARRLSAWGAASALALAPWLCPSPAVAQDLVIPGQNSLAEVDEIELVYAGSQTTPKIIVRGRQSANSFVLSSYRPPDEHLDLLALTAASHPIESCQVTRLRATPPLHLRFDHAENSPCGIIWSLQKAGKSLDALSFRTLHLRGTTSQPLTIEFVDGLTDQRHTHAIVERVTGPFSLDISLAPLARHLDLRYLTELKLLTESDADLVLEEFSLVGPASDPPLSRSMAFWYWDYQSAIRDPKGMLAACEKQHCRRILLQLPDLRDSDQIWSAYTGLFGMAASANIELFALDGAPDMIDHAAPLIAKVDRLLALTGIRGLPGLQLDIEPYLLESFPEDATIFDRYLNTIDRVKATLDGRTKLSMVIPFWFSSTMHGQRSLAFSVMDRADEVTVMSYRTDVDELITISDDLLRYGALERVPVWLALETTSLLPERHVVLKREQRAALVDGVLDPIRRTLSLDLPSQEMLPGRDHTIWFRIHHRTMIRPERISFSGRSERDVQRTITDIFARIHQSSFSGLVIHDLPGYMALTR